jgi:hypothetical protein
VSSNIAASVMHSVSGSIMYSPGLMDSRMITGSVMLPMLLGGSAGRGCDGEDWDFVPHPAGTSSMVDGSADHARPDGNNPGDFWFFWQVSVPFYGNI